MVMEYTHLGNSDVTISRICLGAMGFGVPNEQHPWTVDLETSTAIIKEALDAGITFFDTAYTYNDGTSEEYLGEALRRLATRDDVRIATKCPPPDVGTREQGFTDREWVRHCLETSLSRLKEDYVDLFICHWWGDDCNMDEVLSTMSALVDEGKARALGMSNLFAWELAEYNARAEERSLHRIDSVQGHYNLINREEEREMIPYCESHDVALTPYSPLAGGRLTRTPKHQGDSLRGRIDHIGVSKYGATLDADAPIIERVDELAQKYGVSMTTIALAWELTTVTAPVVGVTKPGRIVDIVGAFDVKLTEDDIAYLDELYVPHKLVGVMARFGR